MIKYNRRLEVFDGGGAFHEAKFGSLPTFALAGWLLISLTLPSQGLWLALTNVYYFACRWTSTIAQPSFGRPNLMSSGKWQIYS